MKSLRAVAAQAIGHSVRLRGVDRVVRLLMPPDRRSSGSVRMVTRIRNGLLFEVDTASYLEWRLFVYGEYERDVQELIARYLSPGDAAVDVGANIGIHTVAMARAVGSQGEVLAVEPLPWLCDKLRANLTLNGIENVSIAECAAFNRAGAMTIYPSLPGTSNEGQASIHPGPHLADPISVPATTLDALIEKFERPLRLIKVDAEGCERMILEGSRGTLGSEAPYVIFEYAPHYDTPDSTEWLGLTSLLVSEFGYSLRSVERGGMLESALSPPSDTRMVLAIPPGGHS